MFRIKHLCIDTLREDVIMIHQDAVRTGDLGFNPLGAQLEFARTYATARPDIVRFGF